MVFMACVSETVSQVHPNLLIFKLLQPYSGTVPTNYLSALFFPDIKWKWLLLSFVFFTCLVSVTTLNTFRRFQKASHTNLKKNDIHVHTQMEMRTLLPQQQTILLLHLNTSASVFVWRVLDIHICDVAITSQIFDFLLFLCFTLLFAVAVCVLTMWCFCDLIRWRHHQLAMQIKTAITIRRSAQFVSVNLKVVRMWGMCSASHMFSVDAFIFKMLFTEIISYKGR